MPPAVDLAPAAAPTSSDAVFDEAHRNTGVAGKEWALAQADCHPSADDVTRDSVPSRRLAAAEEFHRIHGHLRVAEHLRDNGRDWFDLNRWLVTQRLLAKQGKLSPDRRAALAALGMVWDPFDSAWAHGLDTAAAYRSEYGDLHVPHGYLAAPPPSRPNSGGFPLDTWISCVRSRQHRLTCDQRSALDALGMIWDLPEHQWQRCYQAARAFRDRAGHLKILTAHVTAPPESLRLGAWLGHQRGKHKSGTLSQAHVQALTDLGMRWT